MMWSSLVVSFMTIFLIAEVLFFYNLNPHYRKPPRDKVAYSEMIKHKQLIALALAGLTMTILVLFIISKEDYRGTQIFLFYGLSLLLIPSLVAQEFSGLKTIYNFILRRGLYYWYYSLSLAFLSLVISPDLILGKNDSSVIVMFVLGFILCFSLQVKTFLKELKIARYIS